MADMKIRSATARDILTCASRDGWHGLTPQMADEQIERGPAYAFERDGQVVGVIGLFLQWPGVGSAWMALTNEINGQGLWLTKTARQLMEQTEQQHGLHRIEAVALVDSPRNQVWLESLGFTREQNGVARAYSSTGADMVRFERVLRGGA